MDLSDYIKSGLQSYHKQQGSIFGKCFDPKVKSKKLKEERKDTRAKLMLRKRLITAPLSPYKTPSAFVKAEREIPKEDPRVKKRFEMLKQWKVDRDRKRAEEKSKAKPLFKVTHVSDVLGIPDLQTVNKTIKGKPIKVEYNNKKKSALNSKYEFAPENYQFKGPTNINPIKAKVISNVQKPKLVRQQAFEDTLDSHKNSVDDRKVKKVTICNDKTPKKSQRVYKKTPAKINNAKLQPDSNVRNKCQYNLRSQKLVITTESKASVKVTNTKKVQKKNQSCSTSKPKENTSQHKKEICVAVHPILEEEQQNNCSDSELSTEYPVEECPNSSQSDLESVKIGNRKIVSSTPKTKSNPVVYISPFVTISRGKNSARKEFHSRKSRGGLYDSSPDVEVSTGPKAGAAYFHRLLDDEISRIQLLCDEWNLYKISAEDGYSVAEIRIQSSLLIKVEEQKPPEEACDMINVAIGQSQLLIGKKFKQFRNLIYSCENGDSELPVTCEDLHGYWDTAYIQVENLNKRFENLVLLRANNWEEIIPEKKKVVAKKAVKLKPKAEASSRLKDAIKAARNKAKTHADTEEKDTAINTFDGGFFSIQSPEKSQKHHGRRRSSRNRGLLVDVLTNESIKRESLPSLIMWKTAEAAKSLEKENINTPGRSILKSNDQKSSVSRAKSVLFKDEEERDNVPVAKLISLTPEDNVRMSMRRRLTRTKLF